MATPVEVLRECHRLRKHAKELQAEIDRLPRQLKAQQAKVARQEELRQEAQESLKKLKVLQHGKEVQLKETQTLVAKHERQLNEAGSKKEYDALKAEIASEQAKSKQLEDEILAAMEEVEQKAAGQPEFDKAVKQAKQEAADFEKNAQTRQASLAEQLAQAQASLKEAESGLPEDVRQQYARLVTAMGEEALSAVKDRVCVACNTGITAQNSNDLTAGRLVACKSCGRILYPAA
jgi:uncharacterized protein